jgi:hypothetical protein
MHSWGTATCGTQEASADVQLAVDGLRLHWSHNRRHGAHLCVRLRRRSRRVRERAQAIRQRHARSRDALDREALDALVLVAPEERVLEGLVIVAEVDCVGGVGQDAAPEAQRRGGHAHSGRCPRLRPH